MTEGPTIDSMEEALVAYDADGHLIVCNQTFREMWNYTKENNLLARSSRALDALSFDMAVSRSVMLVGKIISIERKLIASDWLVLLSCALRMTTG